MALDICIKRVSESEKSVALNLVWKVFLEFEAPDYTQNGIDEFCKSIHDNTYLSQLTMYGAYYNNKIVGVIATRNCGTHIALFFVDKKYQRQGVGKKLFQTILENKISKLTVNSSPFAIPIYHKLGFKDTAEEQVINGLRFTPMEYKTDKKKVD